MADTFNLSDVFISYSRRDQAFVKRLHERFKSDNHEVWVDWEDIPESAQWWEEIQSGIEGSTTFVFIISPDSADSKICYDEVQHAVDNNKRIIPIVHREISKSAERLHPRINSHNWLFFRNDDDFDSAYERLKQILHTDLEHAWAHTRYLVRAQEWNTRNRDAVFLLNETETLEADQWLAKAEEMTPEPLPLHRAFIRASVERMRIANLQERKRQKKELQLQRKASRSLKILSAVMLIFLIISASMILMMWNLIQFQTRVTVGFEDFYTRANTYFEDGLYGEAIAEYTHLIDFKDILEDFEARFFDVYYRRGEAMRYVGRAETALEDLNTYIAQHPDNASAYLHRGMAQRALMRFDEAIDDIEQAIALDSELYAAREALLDTYITYGYLDEAIAMYDALTEEFGSCIVFVTGQSGFDDVNVMSRPTLNSELMGTVSTGMAAHPLNIAVDIDNNSQSGLSYRWFELDLPTYEDHSWIRSDSLRIQGNCIAYGYGIQPQRTSTAALDVSISIPNPSMAMLFAMPVDYGFLARYPGNDLDFSGWEIVAAEGTIIRSGGIESEIVETVECMYCGQEGKSVADVEAELGIELAEEGILTNEKWGYGYGNYAVLEYAYTDLPKWTKNQLRSIDLAGMDVYCLYAHLQSLEVKAGDTIAANTAIGTLGHSGNMDSAGLRLECRVLTDENYTQWIDLQDNAIDPNILFNYNQDAFSIEVLDLDMLELPENDSGHGLSPDIPHQRPGNRLNAQNP